MKAPLCFPSSSPCHSCTLVARKHDAPPGSYTKRLFDDHELLRHKLLEEAQGAGG